VGKKDTMKKQTTSALAFALLLTSMFSAATRPRLTDEKDAFNPAPSYKLAPPDPNTGTQAIEQNSKPAAMLQNLTEPNIPADPLGTETLPRCNKSTTTPTPFPDKPCQPSGSPQRTIHLPSLFPVFYDDKGNLARAASN
jgi:hypothetical protein